MIHLYINVANGSLIKSLTSDAAATVPDLVAGDEGREIVLHFVTVERPDAFTLTITELDWSGYAVELGVGVLGAAPSAGSFPLVFGANTAAGLAHNATAPQIETALNALASVIAAGGLDVEGDAGGPWSVVFRSNGARDLLTSANDSLYPDSDVFIQRAQTGSATLAEIQTISIQRKPFVFCETWTPFEGGGLYGLLDCSAVAQIEDLLGSGNRKACTLEIKATPPGGSVGTVSQQNVQVLRTLMPVNVTGPASSASYLTAAQSRALFVWNRADITALTGGGAGALDGIASAALPINILIQTTADARVYKLRAGTDAEDSPQIIRPDDYNAGTNARVWALVQATAGSGDVVGPAESTDGAVALFDGEDGKTLKDGVVLGDAATKDVGSTTGTVCAGNDARLGDARTPVSHADSHAEGEADAIAPADIGACADNDSRLSDARTPVAHKSSHATGQADALAPSDIGAAASGHNHDAAYEPKTLTTKGDLLAFGTAAARLPIGTDGKVLTADSNEALGVKWDNAGGSTTLAVVVADSTGRLALTGKPLGFRAHQADNHHIYEVADTDYLDSERGWADLGSVLPFAPESDAAPTVAGTAQVGVELTATAGTFNGRPTPSHASWQWQISDDGETGWSNITDATASTYTPVSGDAGKYLRAKEGASNACGTGYGYSDPTDAVAAGTTHYRIKAAATFPNQSGGLGHSVDDVLTAVGGTGTTAAQVRVTSVDEGDGHATGYALETAGDYTVKPSDPVVFTYGGPGTDCEILLVDQWETFVP